MDKAPKFLNATIMVFDFGLGLWSVYEGGSRFGAGRDFNGPLLIIFGVVLVLCGMARTKGRL
jgi:hypothetical protein